jgi:hypothetical protein
MITAPARIRRIVVPFLAVGLLFGSSATVGLSVEACRSAAMACGCCQQTIAMARCAMPCCRGEIPLPQRAPAKPEKSTQRSSSDGKFASAAFAFSIDASAPTGFREARFARAVGVETSLVAQHVRLQI